jgi:ATP-binding cassette subfamily B (MDR/TAP) protein 1
MIPQHRQTLTLLTLVIALSFTSTAQLGDLHPFVDRPAKGISPWWNPPSEAASVELVDPASPLHQQPWEKKIASGVSLKLDNSASESSLDEGREVGRLGFWAFMRSVYPSIPHNPFVLLGLVVCSLSGAMTPTFSFFLSRLLFEVAIGAKDVSTINNFGGIVLSIAAIDGILLGSKYFIMEPCGMAWITHVMGFALSKVLAQNKKYFDKPANAPRRVVQVLVKDGDEAQNLVSVVCGQFCVVGTMLGVGLMWALVRGWQLTLFGFAVAPVFAVTMMAQTRLVSRCEIRNKGAREEVPKVYCEVSFSFSFG